MAVQADVAARPQAASGRVQAIDWLRGLVMVLMTIDHAGAALDMHHMHGDKGATWIAGSGLPAGEFLTRWITHICAPAFVLLAGTALALSTEKRAARPGQTAFIVKRGLFIAVLDPLWMSWCFFAMYKMAVFQVLYAIGMGLVCMAFLRRLPTWALLGGAFAIQLGGEFVGGLFPSTNGTAHFLAADPGVWQTPVPYVLGTFLFNGGPVHPTIPGMCAYPLIPWLSMMMAGWVLGRWLLATPQRSNPSRALPMAAIGGALLVVFAIVRGIDGYGNWGLYRDSLAPLEWLHVAKYPPSLSYTTLELGLAFLLLAGLLRLDDGRPRPWLRPLGVLGSTAFFYYLLHVALIQVVRMALHIDVKTYGLTKTWVGAALTVLALYPLCVQYRRYKAAHPDGWTRYI